MSADNFLGIYKVSKRKYIGRGCWAECERCCCDKCSNKIIFTAKSVSEAERLAQNACAEDIYEYGYSFINL